MAWPPTNPATGFTVNVANLDPRPTTIAWGTDQLYAGVIVKSMRASRMIEEVRIENGTGLTSNQVLLYDGDQVEITVIDDRNLPFPNSGHFVTLLNPQTPLNPLGNNDGGGNAASEQFIVINNDYNAARKVEGERVLLCKAYVLGIPPL